MEAWTFSVPVIATAIDGVKDYFSDAAVLVEPSNHSLLADSIIKVMSDKEFATDLGQRGHKLVTGFAWNRIANQIINVYQDVIDDTN
jgi:glycosyltransferase involved in cell wall biosynthesis